MLEDLIVIDSVKMGLNYGLNTVRFPHPVPVNSRLQMISSIKNIEDQKQGVKITFSCDNAKQLSSLPINIEQIRINNRGTLFLTEFDMLFVLPKKVQED